MQITHLEREFKDEIETGKFFISFDFSNKRYIIDSEELHNVACDAYRDNSEVQPMFSKEDSQQIVNLLVYDYDL
jgi:hypothetical protein